MAGSNADLLAQAASLNEQADGMERIGQSSTAAQMRRAANEIESRAMGSALSAKFRDPTTAAGDPITGFFKSIPLWGWGVGLGVVGILLAGTAYQRSANPRRKRRRSNPGREDRGVKQWVHAPTDSKSKKDPQKPRVWDYEIPSMVPKDKDARREFLGDV